ncbi:MAG: N-6 DNA methylase [Nitrospinae bacterium]|nr:N-6 DNA methylase [Nitrospinota bacterium]
MRKYTIDEIFKSTETKHSLSLFGKKLISSIAFYDKNGKPYLKCFGSDKERPAKPEEIVRQLFIKKLLDNYGYPKERIQVEKDVWFGSGVSDKRADIVVLQKDLEHPFIIVEVKKPNRKDGIEQLKSYCNAEGSPIGVWTNGSELVILHREEPNIFTNISDIPTADQSLQDVIAELWTLEKLTRENKLIKERVSLKSIILDLEDLVLANAGVDAFEEVFKLIYAKLYDEWAAKNVRGRNGRVYFRIYGESPKELYDKINNLFKDAINKWKGVFNPMDRIELSPNHLMTCVSFLQDIKLFNSNLQVIDEAFEYLVTQVAKGAKGQYFTPRHVIDMAVNMLNPKETEKVIDTAAGSCGFTVHTIQYIAGEPTSPSGLPEHAKEFAQNNIFGIDFDNRSVKIAKAINLIAGDGKSNVYKLNSLESSSWDDEGKSACRPMLTRFSEDRAKDEDNQKNFKYFDFDVLLTNPPFAGNIKEKQILKNYLLAEKKGKTVSKIGRDILFIERNLNFIKPGGRMAIVLPQGRLNNTNDEYIRKFIMERARILAVVGLHGNTFKPHTGTKTSVLFLQKYTEKELEKINAVQSKYGKKWQDFINVIASKAKQSIREDDLPEELLGFLNSFYGSYEEEPEDADEEKEAGDEKPKTETTEDLQEAINILKEEIENLQKEIADADSIKKKELTKKLKAFQKNLANEEYSLNLKTLGGRLNILLNDEKDLESFHKFWLQSKSAKELSYPIFMATSQKSGKDNSGEYVYKKGVNGDLMLDENGHLIIDHDLDFIAEKFIEFAKKQRFDFWKEGYRAMYSEMPLAAETETKYKRKQNA